MTISPPLPRTDAPAPRPTAAPAPASTTAPRRRWRDRLRDSATLRREERAFALAVGQAPTLSARSELRALREYGRG